MIFRILLRFRNRDAELDRKRTDKSFMVPKQEIVDNDYDLSINKYKRSGVCTCRVSAYI